MRINNNLMAMNTHRQLGINTAAGAKSIEKLSSGYRINRAGDDAAGLSISEKMRSQIRGLDQASRNAQDSISLIQTAEGALSESQNILQRMRELSVQSANDTNTGEDRKAIQTEMNQLVDEIDRISDNTEFNSKKLLDGSLDGAEKTTTTTDVSKNNILKVGDVTIASLTVTEAADSMKIIYDGEEIELKGLTAKAYDGTTDGAKIEDFAADLQSLIDANETLAGKVSVTGVQVDGTNATLSFSSDKEIEIQSADSNSITLSNIGLTAGASSFEENYELVGSEFSATTFETSSNTLQINYNGQDVNLDITVDDVYDGSSAATSLDGLVEALQADIDADDSLKGHIAVSNEDGAIKFTSDKEFKITDSDSITDFAELGITSGTEATEIVGVTETETADATGAAAIMQIGSNSGQTFEVNIAQMDSTTMGVLEDSDVTVNEEHYDYSLKGDALTDSVTITSATDSFKVVYGGDEYAINDLVAAVYDEEVESDMTALVDDIQSKIDENNDLAGNVYVSFTDGAISFSSDKDLSIETADANPLAISTALGITSGASAVEEAYKAEGTEITSFATDFNTNAALDTLTLKYDGTDTTLTLTDTDYSAAGVGFEDLVADINDKINADTSLKGHVSARIEDSKLVFVSDKELSVESFKADTVAADASIGFTIGQDAIEQDMTADETAQVGSTLASLKVDITDSEGGVLTGEDSQKAIDVIDAALNQVSFERSKLGAYQNRLEHTIANLDTGAENLQAAESRIRDVDMAKEMMEFTKNNILQQAAQSMLAQANQAPQGVLQLLG